MRRSSSFWVILFSLAILPTTGCLLRTRPVEEQYSKAPLKDATQQQLIESINRQAQSIQSLKATVDIDTSAGGVKKGQITDYKEIRGYVLARKPAMLHMVGLLPIVRTTAFDMVSDGKQFELWIPPKNRFVIGQNHGPAQNYPEASELAGKSSSQTATQTLENLRPQNIYDALLIPPIDSDNEIAVVENGYETLHDAKGHRVLQEDYELVVIRKFDKGWGLSRKIIFSRLDLNPRRQYVYDEDGQLATDARYAEYKNYNGVSFASRIEIWRPQEEYDITLNMLKVDINQPLTDQQFTLEQPAGAEIVHLDRPQSSLVVPLGDPH